MVPQLFAISSLFLAAVSACGGFNYCSCKNIAGVAVCSAYIGSIGSGVDCNEFCNARYCNGEKQCRGGGGDCAGPYMVIDLTPCGDLDNKCPKDRSC